jgi:hypothetical protein
MKTIHTELRPISPDIQSLLDFERLIAPQRDEMRSRAFARARTSLAQTAVPVPTAIHFSHPQLLAAAGLAFLVVAAGGAALYELVAESRHARPSTSGEVSPVLVPEAPQMAPVQAAETAGEFASGPVQPAAKPTSSLSAEHDRGAKPKVVARNTPDVSDFGAELRLLQRARESVRNGQFAEALVPIADHERRFPAGRLVEEREALRVRALSGLGQFEDAHRAAIDFRARFPRSVLLPGMSESAQPGPP